MLKKIRKNYNYLIERLIEVGRIIVGMFLVVGFLAYAGGDLEQGKTDATFNLISISLTLFGFCLVGGIFERGNKPKIQISVFKSAIQFLSASLLLVMSIATPYLVTITKDAPKLMNFIGVMGGFALFFGIIFFVVGFFQIYGVLHDHLRKIDPKKVKKNKT